MKQLLENKAIEWKMAYKWLMQPEFWAEPFLKFSALIFLPLPPYP